MYIVLSIPNLIDFIMKKRRLLLLVFAFISLLLFISSCKKDEKEEEPPVVVSPLKVEIVSPKADTTILTLTNASFVLNVTPAELRNKVRTTVYVDDKEALTLSFGYFKYFFSATKYGIGTHKVKFVIKDEDDYTVTAERNVTVYKEIITINYVDSVYFKDGVIPSYWAVTNAVAANQGYMDDHSLQMNSAGSIDIPIPVSVEDRYFSFVKKGEGTVSVKSDFSALPIAYKSENMGDGWYRQTYKIIQGTSRIIIDLSSEQLLKMDNFILKPLGRPLFDEFKCHEVSSPDRFAIFSAKILSVNGGVTKSGFCWSNTNKLPTYWDNHDELFDTLTDYTLKIKPFQKGLTAYVRAFSVNDVGVSYSNVITIGPVDPIMPSVSWPELAWPIADSVVLKGGMIVDSFGLAVVERGFCMKIQAEPTIDDIRVVSKDKGASFNGYKGGLDEHKIYYVKAYAITSAGVSYSQRRSFYSLAVESPILTTSDVGPVTRSTAYCSGTVTNDGYARIQKQGVVYSTNSSPTTNDQVVYTSTASNAIHATLTGLQANTKYYYRTFAINKKYTGYGPVKEFTTGRYDLGDQAEGGRVIYLDNVGIHGLAMADQDVSPTYIWSNDSTVLLGVTANPSGLENTQLIISKTPGENNAALACYNFTSNGYDDWFLPSFEEFRQSIEGVKISGLTSGVYWTSTERLINKALSLNVQAATVKLEFKSKLRRVRPFRSF